MQAFDGVCRPGALPLARRQAGEGEQVLAGILQAVGDGPVSQPPLAQKCPAARLDLSQSFLESFG